MQSMQESKDLMINGSHGQLAHRRGTGVGCGVKPKQLKTLVEAQQYKCGLTGVDLTPKTASVDHVVPLRHGGQHVIENLMVVHSDVNIAKHTALLDEFVGMCALIAENMARKGFDIEAAKAKWIKERS